MRPQSETDRRNEELAFRLLTSLSAGSRPPGGTPNSVLGPLLPVVRDSVRRLKSKWGTANLESESDDLLNEVLTRLLQSPPEPIEGGSLRRLLGWVKTTTSNLLVDSSRDPQASAPKTRPSVAPSAGDKGSDLDRIASRSRDIERVEAIHDIRWARGVLARDYPRGLDVLDAMGMDADLSSHEIAQRMGTTAVNVDTMKFRIRQVLRQARAADERRRA